MKKEQLVMENRDNKITFLKKRDGSVVPFEKMKIAEAIFKAIKSVGGQDRLLADELAESVSLYLNKKYGGTVPDIETIQDAVERVLIEMGQADTAKSYILYREKRAQLRKAMENAQIAVNEKRKTWDRKIIVSSIVTELGLPYMLAERIMDIVEANITDKEVPPEQLNLSIN